MKVLKNIIKCYSS